LPYTLTNIFEIKQLRCSAQLHDVYWKTTEKIILETDLFPKHGNGANGNHVNPDDFYDQYALHEDHLHNKKNSYLTQLQGELNSLISLVKQHNYSTRTLEQKIRKIQ